MPPDDVRRAVADARVVAETWGATSPRERAAALREWRARLWRRSGALADLLVREAGMGLDDALREVLAVVEHLRWIEGNATRVLAGRTDAVGPLRPGLTARTSYAAEGVVGVVVRGRAVLRPVAAAAAVALVGGNTVVVDPGPRLGVTLRAWADLLDPGRTTTRRLVVLDDRSDRAHDESAVALASAAPDHLLLLGARSAADRLAGACARARVPLSVVPVAAPITLVAPDADLAAAARAVAALASTAGSEERCLPEVYVAPDVLEAFGAALDRVDPEASSATMPGAETLAGVLAAPRRAIGVLARRRSGDRAGAVGAAGAAVGVLSASAGGGRPRAEVRTAPAFDDLLRRLRNHPGAEVAVHSRRHGERLAELLDCATVVVNPGRPTSEGLPRELVGSRGWGVFAGEDGLRTFVHARTITARRTGAARALALPAVALSAAPGDLLLATPAGRLATRLALHLRHSLG